MHRKKAIYTTRVDTPLATDEVRPYGERLSIISESERKRIAWKLLHGRDAELYDETKGKKKK